VAPAPAVAIVDERKPVATRQHVVVQETPLQEARTEEPQPATTATAAPERGGAAAPVQQVSPQHNVAPAKQNVAPATGPNEVERRFQAGMALLKSGKSAEAARELLAAADAGGDDPLAADARYFAAAALTKAGRKTEAERALVAFIDRAPTSIRRGRAAVMLARLIAERGDNAAARAWFESALGDADASVVAAARAGIAALH
ncbi:MAG TPA: tetratricopeptide repeat protein, partial [Kofleriaceae bacterium]|nr:tetratricopeptide repeat protein [Kofleriaceae bacterium]